MSSRVITRCCSPSLAELRDGPDDGVSPVTSECLLCLGDPVLVALVEDPLLDLLAPDQARPGEQLQMLAAGRLADAQLLRDEQGAHAVFDQIAVALRREAGHRVTQPLEDLKALLVAQRLDEIHIKHKRNYGK